MEAAQSTLAGQLVVPVIILVVGTLLTVIGSLLLLQMKSFQETLKEHGARIRGLEIGYASQTGERPSDAQKKRGGASA